MSQSFTAVAHIYLRSGDYAAAISEADDIKLAVERDLLDTDEMESMDIVEVIEADDVPIPTFLMMQLRRARNILIRQRTKETYELARALDEQIYAMSMRLAGNFEQARGSYDYSNMMQVLKEVLDGGNPLDH